MQGGDAGIAVQVGLGLPHQGGHACQQRREGGQEGGACGGSAGAGTLRLALTGGRAQAGPAATVLGQIMGLRRLARESSCVGGGGVAARQPGRRPSPCCGSHSLSCALAAGTSNTAPTTSADASNTVITARTHCLLRLWRSAARAVRAWHEARMTSCSLLPNAVRCWGSATAAAVNCVSRPLSCCWQLAAPTSWLLLTRAVTRFSAAVHARIDWRAAIECRLRGANRRPGFGPAQA